MIYRRLKKPPFSVRETAHDGCLISQWWRFPTAQDRPKLPCGNLPEIVRLLSVYLLGGDQEIMICKGVVKENVVLLQAGAQLPDGAEVEVRLLERPLTRQEVFARSAPIASDIPSAWTRSLRKRNRNARSTLMHG
jgi:hypothetical protein